MASPPDGQQAAIALRSLLRELGADEARVARIARWADLGERGYVYVPPLQAEVVERLVARCRGAES